MWYVNSNAENLGLTFVSIFLWVGVWGVFDKVIDLLVVQDKYQLAIYLVLTLAASLTLLFVHQNFD